MNITIDANEDASLFHNQFESQIKRFYEGKKIFLTGGTGFLGKLIVEKLLRCTNVAVIYILIRTKNDKSINTRLNEYFDNVVFNRLKNEVPKLKHRLVGIPGNSSLENLGISNEDRKLLIENVNIVFHAAATVKFNEKLKLAYAINVKGTESVLHLCKEMTNLQACIHVSTFYSQCHLKQIDEVFYETTVNYRHLESVLEQINGDSIDRMTPKLIGDSPNTYTFTKALAEAVVKEQGSGLPVGVFRPSIIIPTYSQPIKGWIDNLVGPTGIYAFHALGLLRTLQMKQDAVANLVPGDTCVAGLIAAAWDVASKTCERIPSNIPIYNYGSTGESTITWGEYYLHNRFWTEMYPVSTAWWCIRFDSTENCMVYTLKKTLYHTLPSIILDILSLCSGRKPTLIKLYNKIHKFSNLITYFTMNEWKCNNNNVVKLWSKLNEADRKLFPFCMSTVHWARYFKSHVLGVRLYLLKDSNQTLRVAKKRMQRFTVLHNIIKFGFFFTFFHIVLIYLYNNLGIINI